MDFLYILYKCLIRDQNVKNTLKNNFEKLKKKSKGRSSASRAINCKNTYYFL